jgi:O-antigen/teichoic acid export membrane protein
MGRIYLPAFSSSAGDPSLLRSRVEKSLRINASITWPACAVLASLSAPIIGSIFTSKWAPAHMMLYAYCVNAMMLAVGVPLSELFFSQGDAWFNFRLCLLWAIATWTGGTYAVAHYGLRGFAIFQAALQIGWLWAFLHAREPEGLRVFAPLREPLVLAVLLAGGNWLLLRLPVITSIYRLLAVLVVEGIVCGAILVRMVLSWRSRVGIDPLGVARQNTRDT